MAARKKNKGLVYLRRSSGRQELSLRSQLEWAIAEAARLEVQIDASLADLDHMQKARISSYKSLRIDDAISGGDLNRPGFIAVNQDVLADHSISHLFAYRRDRIARPPDAIPLVAIEKKLRSSGVTIVLFNGIALPFEQGESSLVDDLSIMIEYYQSGEFLKIHAERVIVSKQLLARGGYWTGGIAPYGFVRVLVDAQDNVIQELEPGFRARKQGCHVKIMPKFEDKIRVWLLMLDLMGQGWGGTRIARHLNDLGIPSPDAGKKRTDHGVAHQVSGKWCGRTVIEICRNPAIQGVLAFGRRSEGQYRRLGETGPRAITQEDRHEDGRLKLIHNKGDRVILAATGFRSSYDEDKWQAVQQQLDNRGDCQRGIPRAKDPAKYPLACRIIDMTDDCGAIMYGRTSGKRALYVCGRYLRTCSAECDNNAVDGEAMLKVVLSTIAQVFDRAGRRTELVDLLEQRAREGSSDDCDSDGQEALRLQQDRRNQLAQHIEIAGRRMAIEQDSSRYEMIARQFDLLQEEFKVAESRIIELSRPKMVLAPSVQVEAALRLFDSIRAAVSAPHSRHDLPEVFQKLGLRIGLNFVAGIKGKKREVRQLAGGVLAFRDSELPVALHGRDRVDSPRGLTTEQGLQTVTDPIEANESKDVCCSGETSATISGASAHGNSPPGPFDGHREGISCTKANRGDKI